MGIPLVELNNPVTVMRFRLVYDGTLPSDSNRTSTKDIKHHIRREVHKQIRELLNSDSTFRKDVKDNDIIAHVSKDSLTTQVTLGKFTFASLVSAENWRTCHLDILLLRRVPSSIFMGGDIGGDIDNRIKVLLDGLRRPTQQSELPDDAAPSDSEHPFYCLLDNDNFVTSFSVHADQIFTPVGEEQNKDYARAIIDVTVQVSRVPWRNMPFLCD